MNICRGSYPEARPRKRACVPARRRDNTALPLLVFIRVRKPCLGTGDAGWVKMRTYVGLLSGLLHWANDKYKEYGRFVPLWGPEDRIPAFRCFAPRQRRTSFLAWRRILSGRETTAPCMSCEVFGHARNAVRQASNDTKNVAPRSRQKHAQRFSKIKSHKSRAYAFQRLKFSSMPTSRKKFCCTTRCSTLCVTLAE